MGPHAPPQNVSVIYGRVDSCCPARWLSMTNLQIFPAKVQGDPFSRVVVADRQVHQGICETCLRRLGTPLYEL